MSWITLDVDIDIDEFLSNCSKRDVDYIIQCLREDGHLDQNVIDNKKSTKDNDWENSLDKLKINRHQLTVEEENILLKICDRLV